MWRRELFGERGPRGEQRAVVRAARLRVPCRQRMDELAVFRMNCKNLPVLRDLLEDFIDLAVVKRRDDVLRVRIIIVDQRFRLRVDRVAPEKFDGGRAGLAQLGERRKIQMPE